MEDEGWSLWGPWDSIFRRAVSSPVSIRVAMAAMTAVSVFPGKMFASSRRIAPVLAGSSFNKSRGADALASWVPTAQWWLRFQGPTYTRIGENRCSQGCRQKAERVWKPSFAWFLFIICIRCWVSYWFDTCSSSECWRAGPIKTAVPHWLDGVVQRTCSMQSSVSHQITHGSQHPRGCEGLFSPMENTIPIIQTAFRNTKQGRRRNNHWNNPNWESERASVGKYQAVSSITSVQHQLCQAAMAACRGQWDARWSFPTFALDPQLCVCIYIYICRGDLYV